MANLGAVVTLFDSDGFNAAVGLGAAGDDQVVRTAQFGLLDNVHFYFLFMFTSQVAQKHAQGC